MRNLIEFLIKYSSAFIFTLLLALSILMLISHGRFHSSVWFTSANAVSSKVYGINNNITGYFNLREINASLQQSNARLESEVLNLRQELQAYKALLNDSTDLTQTKRYDYVLATVLNNNTTHPHNYFTIDKGASDGIESGMGVVDHNGIVGIVNVVGPHTARVISLLNVTQRISVRLKNTNTVGSLVWKVNDPGVAYMEEIPRHSNYAVGDTVVTSGFSSAFPADIPVGIVESKVKTENDNFHVLKIKLASDLTKLSAVRVIKDSFKAETDSLQTLDIITE